ncbi:hypothetical protein [Candidatus Magnetaquicoccus inordinatus]|uniref:hypothetical protein n=1 Tax=Candidatus Magnetaquicoccus inordinatus TaxID=2496818 RepID=UPI00102CB51F|nr:hypothetical protein [Candidatus Magnetaquicoccus inordinatus]
MKLETTDSPDQKRLDNLPQLTLSEAAWMAGITPDALERFLTSTPLAGMRNLPLLELVRACFTLLGQREAQMAIMRLQLTSALQREKELSEALHSKLSEGLHFLTIAPPASKEPEPPPSTPAPPPPAATPVPTAAPFIPQAGLVDLYVNRQKVKKQGKKK